MPTSLETDYLVVGAGATGMAFSDTLIDESDADVIIVDRRCAPGGHWIDGYPFLRLHQPSGVYGVNSMRLGGENLDADRGDEQLYERASAAEVVGYYDRVLHQRLLASGRVRFFGSCDYLGGGRFRSLLSGEEYDVAVRRKTVDATVIHSDIPATTPPPFDVDEGARCVPVGELGSVAEPPDGFVVIGAGKTAQDACLWLLASGVPPDAIRWVRPRDPWLFPRRYLQPGPGLPTTIDGYTRAIEAAAAAQSVGELFAELEAGGLLLRIDPEVAPTTYKGATASDRDLAALRAIEHVVRLGHVRRIDPSQITLDGGTVATTPATLHVHCASRGVRVVPGTPIFDETTIRPQMVRFGQVCLSAALVAYVEATRSDDAEKNELCAPIPGPDTTQDWLRTTAANLRADYRWTQAPDVAAWLDGARLNLSAGLMSHAGNPLVQQSLTRFASNAAQAAANLRRLLVTP